MAEFLNLTGDPESINRLYAQYKAVTPAEVQRVAKEYFKNPNRSVVRLVHQAPAADSAGEGATEGGEAR